MAGDNVVSINIREDEEMYRSIIENASNIVLHIDTEGHILYINDFGRRFFGFGNGEMIGKNIIGTIVPETDTDGVSLIRSMKGGMPGCSGRFTSRQNENIRCDGSRVWIAWTNRALYDPRGQLYGILSIGNDISGRKRAEAALKNSEAKFKAVFDHAAIGISLAGPDRRIIANNLALGKFIGYSVDELTGIDFITFTHPEDAESDIELYEALVDGRIDHYHLEKRYVKKNGSITWGRLTVSAVCGADGEFQFAVRMLEDINDRKRMENELRESAAGLAKAQALAHIGSWSWDLKIGQLLWSDEQYRIFGLKPQEFPIDHKIFCGFVHPGDLEAVEDSIAASLRGHFPVDIEYRIIGRNGRKRIVRCMGDTVYENGEPVQMYGTLQDITERKRADEALLLAKNDAELYVDLMGHDINNMNQITMGFLELARDILSREGSLGVENVELLDRAYESLQNSSRLIDSVRKLQRGRAGFYRTKPQDMDEIMGDVVASFRDIPGRDITIDYMPSHRFYVTANELLKDVFTSLVGNSIKHSRGALAIHISADKLIQGDKAYCRVVIEDNGPGIPDSLKRSLFDRLNLSTTRARGKGFGLCLTKMLVDDYGGQFWVEDRVQGDYTKGCRFVVVLPESD